MEGENVGQNYDRDYDGDDDSAAAPATVAVACMSINSVGGGRNEVVVNGGCCTPRVPLLRPLSVEAVPKESPFLKVTPSRKGRLWETAETRRFESQNTAHCRWGFGAGEAQPKSTFSSPVLRSRATYLLLHCIACSLMQRRARAGGRAGQVTTLPTDIKESLSCGADMKRKMRVGRVTPCRAGREV